MATFTNPLEKAAARINEIRQSCTSYKIGKTGMLLESRLNEPDYKDDYTSIEPVYESNSKELCSFAESELINTFIDDPQCDNKKDGDHSIGDNLADTPPFYVYVVSR